MIGCPSPAVDLFPSLQHCSKFCSFTNNPLAVSAVAAPFLGAAAWAITKTELTDEPIMKITPEREEYFKKYKDDQHGEYKDFFCDAAEELVGHLG